MREACLALDYPVVSGNVSLYNETNGSAHLPTPAIGGVGLIADAAQARRPRAETRRRRADPDRRDHGAISAPRSICARSLGREDGAPPPVDLAAERRNGDFVRAEIAAGRVAACHDLSDGGLLVARGRDGDGGRHRRRASTAAGRPAGACLALRRGPGALSHRDRRRPTRVLAAAQTAGVPARSASAQSAGDPLTVAGAGAISVAELRRINEAGCRPIWRRG